jgi:hypothetical protein
MNNDQSCRHRQVPSFNTETFMNNYGSDLAHLNPEWNTMLLAIGRTTHRITIAGALIAVSLLAFGALLAWADLIAAALVIIPVLFFRQFIRAIAYFVNKRDSLVSRFRHRRFTGPR